MAFIPLIYGVERSETRPTTHSLLPIFRSWRYQTLPIKSLIMSNENHRLEIVLHDYNVFV